MRTVEKIDILKNLIKKLSKTINSNELTNEQIQTTREIAVLKEINTNLMHSIGLQTEEEIQHEKSFQ
jgi:hypothetical protein